MNLKTYQAQTMAEALASVRRDLGKDAVILNTRSIKKGGIFGFRTKAIVEITATRGVNVLHPDQKRKILKAGPELPAPSILPPTSDHLRQELVLVKQMVQELLHQNKRDRHPGVPQELFAAYLCLINQQVAQEVANDVIDQLKTTLSSDELKNTDKVRALLAQSIEKMIPPADPIELKKTGKAKIIALVGPTGVGKTTTIAKLAANFKLRENKSVGLITIDTYRIAAVDQLRTYAGIINVPLKVVLSPEELRLAVQSMSHLDLILIDTAGRSQNDDLKLRELKNFLQAAGPDEIHLVLSSTASQSVLLSTIQRFSSLNYDHIIFSKLDEAVGLGILLNVMKKLDRAVSYITTGQNVPEDIEPGSADTLARMLVNPQSWPDEKQVATGFALGGEVIK
jgi:flagellar biosynthesis protein FlhF